MKDEQVQGVLGCYTGDVDVRSRDRKGFLLMQGGGYGVIWRLVGREVCIRGRCVGINYGGAQALRGGPV
ncbi:hypothetical protein BLA47_15405 [Yersinia pseudotuberculosis]|nr:hypothetical protein BLA47_15405 [Yersinia pseudotuberculosis]